jgi:hypothetical protein
MRSSGHPTDWAGQTLPRFASRLTVLNQLPRPQQPCRRTILEIVTLLEVPFERFVPSPAQSLGLFHSNSCIGVGPAAYCSQESLTSRCQRHCRNLEITPSGRAPYGGNGSRWCCRGTQRLLTLPEAIAPLRLRSSTFNILIQCPIICFT